MAYHNEGYWGGGGGGYVPTPPPKDGPNKDAAPSEMATPIPQPMASGVYNPLLALELIGYGYYIGF